MLALHEPSPYLFTCQGRPLITDTFNKRLKKYTAEIDIPYLSTHKLRFTSASLAKNQGQCEQDIQHNLGHSNIQQTQHYDSHATTEYNYGMAADIYDKKYNVTKLLNIKKSPQALINSRLEATHSNAADRNRTVLLNLKY